MFTLEPVHHHDYFTRLQRRLGAMDVNTKLIIEEMEKKFSALDQKWEKKFSELASSRDDRISVLEAAGSELSSWKPKVDGAMEDIKLEIRKLNKLSDRSSLEAPAEPGLLPKPGDISVRQGFGSEAEGMMGHRQEQSFKDHNFGSVLTYLPDPQKGMHHSSFTPICPSGRGHMPQIDTCDTRLRYSDSGFHALGKLPKLTFPVFDGDNPRLWISRCESYFDMYQVEPAVWIRFISMQLSLAVACWFQAIRRRFVDLRWPLFCKLLMDRFGRDQHQTLLHQLFRIRQSSSVSEYISRFSTLMD